MRVAAGTRFEVLADCVLACPQVSESRKTRVCRVICECDCVEQANGTWLLGDADGTRARCRIAYGGQVGRGGRGGGHTSRVRAETRSSSLSVESLTFS